ncbi:hypothetical protein GCM10027174_42680 [Salinifilum aidingensis]
MSDSGQDHAAAIAAAVLYKGSRSSSARPADAPERFRWQFGVLSPSDAVGRDVGEDATMVTDCLVVDEPAAELRVRLRFLQLQDRGVEQLVSAHEQPPEFAPVAELDCGACLSGREEVEHDIHVVTRELGELGERPVDQLLRVPGTRQFAPLHSDRGSQRGRVVRTRQPVDARLRVTPGRRSRGVRKLRFELVNTTVSSGDAHDRVQRAARERALHRSLLSPHLLLSVTRGRFLSVLDPPDWAGELARECVHRRLWPVLTGDHGDDRSVLASPVILHDRPRVSARHGRWQLPEVTEERDIPAQRRTS